MKHEVRDNDVELFGGSEPEHVALLEINPVRKAKNPRVLFRLVEAGPFEAGVLERVNPSYPRVPVELCTDTAQEGKVADVFSIKAAIQLVSWLAFGSGIIVIICMRETKKQDDKAVIIITSYRKMFLTIEK
jgi:hypothetical protein